MVVCKRFYFLWNFIGSLELIGRSGKTWISTRMLSELLGMALTPELFTSLTTSINQICYNFNPQKTMIYSREFFPCHKLAQWFISVGSTRFFTLLQHKKL
jgi:hypothetical protein